MGTSTQPQQVAYANNGQLDAFARLRTSAPVTLFDSTSQYDAAPLLFSTALTAGGTVTHVQAASAVRLATGVGATDKAIRQTRQYFRYQPGKSQLVIMTGVLGASAANVVKRLGYYDDNNGVFFELRADGLYCVQRSKVSGVVVDTAVKQDAWNIDKLTAGDFILDTSKANIFFIDLEWLGVGRVRFGVFTDKGLPRYCHSFDNANMFAVVYMQTACLPVRAEIANTGASAGSSFDHICTSVISEGGFEADRGFIFTASNATTPLAVTTRRPLLSIRPKALFNTLVNRGQMLLESLEALGASQSFYLELVYGGALTGASFASVNASSIAEYDTAATAIAGGLVVHAGYLSSAVGNQQTNLNDLLQTRLPLTLDIAGANPISLSVVATSMGAAGTVAAALEWRELY